MRVCVIEYSLPVYDRGKLTSKANKIDRADINLLVYLVYIQLSEHESLCVSKKYCNKNYAGITFLFGKTLNCIHSNRTHIYTHKITIKIVNLAEYTI